MTSAPPSYEQSIGPDFVPIGTAADLESAAKVAGSSRVYAALRPSKDSIDKVTNMVIIPYSVCPLLWFQLPCILPAALNRKAALKNTLYVITNDSVIVSIADHEPPCACGCTTGRDTAEITFESITDVQVDNRGRGCTCCRVPSVRLSLVSKQVQVLVENTEGVAHLIRELRRASRDHRNGPAVVQQPVAVITQAPAQSRRIFVASSSAPSDYAIVNLGGDADRDWEVFLDNIRGTLNFPPKAAIKLSLAEVGAGVSSAAQLSANDKVVATLVY